MKNNPFTLLNEVSKLQHDTDSLIERHQELISIKRSELKLACMSDDPARIEKARQELIDTFTAGVDETLVYNKKYYELRKKIEGALR